MKSKFLNLPITILATGMTLAACGKSAQEKALEPTISNSRETTVENAQGSTLDIGRGFDSHSAVTRGKCIEFSGKDSELQSRGGNSSQSATFELREVESFESLSKMMSVTASGKFQSGIYQGSAAANYFESSDYTAYSSFLTVHVKVINSDVALKNHKLTADAKNALTSDKAFFDMCGDSFVSQRSEGGEFYAIVEFKSKSEEHRRQVQAKVRASAGVWSLRGDFEQKLSSMSQLAETNVRIIRVGGSGPLPDFAGGENGKYSDLVDYARKFPDVVAPLTGKAWTIAFTVEDYKIVPGVSVRPPQLLVQKEAIERLGEIKLNLKSILNRINYILRNEGEFSDVNSDELNSASGSLDGELNRVRSAATRCLADPFTSGNCDVPSDIKVPDVKWPKWSNGQLVIDRCESARLWAKSSGYINDEVYQKIKAVGHTFFRNPDSGAISIGQCVENSDYLAHFPTNN